ncbi:FtsX-like permease family protein [Dactylosporangium sp. CA-139066]|uniref:FtsX-like permease family protein n=1 Tax=Dactylosporangium sp. CA-139066 TaxID=3239930 RepID=UPI003D92C554
MTALRLWGNALRIARREAARARGRTALVVALIALPVVALAFLAATDAMFTLTPAERADRDLGRFDATVVWPYDGPVLQDREGGQVVPRDGKPLPAPAGDAADAERAVLAALPPGSTVTRAEEDHLVAVRTPAGRTVLPALLLDLADSRYRGHIGLVRGRAPGADDEVALDAAALARTGTRIGGALILPDTGRTLTVVGEFERPGDLGAALVLRPGALPPRPGTWYADTPQPLTWPQVQALNARGMAASARELRLGPDRAGMLPALTDPTPDRRRELAPLLLGMAFLEVVLLAGPAFAVGARRRRRELALVAANGATPAHLRRIVLADGVVLGAAAAVAGVALGVAAAMLARPLVEAHVLAARAGAYRINLPALAGLAALAVVTGAAAALAPAIAAGRAEVLAGLTGRRPAARTGRRLAVTGLAAVGLGAAVAAWGVAGFNSRVVLAGVLVAEAGLVLSTPALLALLARLGGGLPLAPRIALRDAARNRTAAAPAVCAVMAAVIGSITVGVYGTSIDARAERMAVPTLPPGYASVYQPSPHTDEPPPRLPTEQLRAALSPLPVRESTEVRAVVCADRATGCGLEPTRAREQSCPYVAGTLTPPQQRAAAADPRCDELDHIMLGDATVLHIVDDGAALAPIGGLSGADLDRARATLQAGGAVVADPLLVHDGRVLLRRTGTRPDDSPLSVPGYYAATAYSAEFWAISPDAVRRAGYDSAVIGLVVATTRPPTIAERDAYYESLARLGHGYGGEVATPYHYNSGLISLVLALAAGAVALGAAAIATALSAVDSRPDHATLGAIGASPGLRRRLALSRAGLVAGLGSVLGVAGGFGAGAALIAALTAAAL